MITRYRLTFNENGAHLLPSDARATSAAVYFDMVGPEYTLASDYDALAARFDSAVNTLRDIADMGRKAGSESARHRLRELGIECPDYGSMT